MNPFAGVGLNVFEACRQFSAGLAALEKPSDGSNLRGLADGTDSSDRQSDCNNLLVGIESNSVNHTVYRIRCAEQRF